jgi:hypothetical protein
MNRLLIFVFILFAGSANAQQILLKCGISYSTVSAGKYFSAPGYKFTMKPGFVGGIGADFNISEKFAIQPEILYHQKGWKDVVNTNSGGVIKDEFTLNYLEVPVAAKYKIRSFYLAAGVWVAYALDGKMEQTQMMWSPPYKFEENVRFGKEGYRRWDAGAQIGFGTKIKDMFVAELRYGRSLVNFDELDNTSDDKTKNISLQLTIGYTFHRF